MAICNVNIAGLCRDCESSKGGIVEVYAFNYGEVVSATTSAGTISDLSLASGAKAYKYEFRKGTGSMTSTLNVDPANGVNYVSTELVLQFTKMETRKRIEMAALAVGELAFIVKDANGIYWYLGKDEAVTATAGTGQTGTAVGDGNFYNITFTDESLTWPMEVLPSVVEGLTVLPDCNA